MLSFCSAPSDQEMFPHYILVTLHKMVFQIIEVFFFFSCIAIRGNLMDCFTVTTLFIREINYTPL